MNNITLVGRMVRDPEMFAKGETSMAKFTIAVQRAGKDAGADFPSCVAFGKTAEIIEKYFCKGKPIGIVGRISTGSYEKQDGTKVYTTDVVAERVEFVGSKEESENPAPAAQQQTFTQIDDDIPF